MGVKSAGRGYGSTFFFELPLYSASHVRTQQQLQLEFQLQQQQQLHNQPLKRKRSLLSYINSKNDVAIYAEEKADDLDFRGEGSNSNKSSKKHRQVLVQSPNLTTPTTTSSQRGSYMLFLFLFSFFFFSSSSGGFFFPPLELYSKEYSEQDIVRPAAPEMLRILIVVCSWVDFKK